MGRLRYALLSKIEKEKRNLSRPHASLNAVFNKRTMPRFLLPWLGWYESKKLEKYLAYYSA
jgi:hypothetical protein